MFINVIITYSFSLIFFIFYLFIKLKFSFSLVIKKPRHVFANEFHHLGKNTLVLTLCSQDKASKKEVIDYNWIKV